jgi:hypothetical protein
MPGVASHVAERIARIDAKRIGGMVYGVSMVKEIGSNMAGVVKVFFGGLTFLDFNS